MSRLAALGESYYGGYLIVQPESPASRISCVDLTAYDNARYEPGRGYFVRALWFLAGSPLVRSRVNPFSNLKAAILRLFGARIGNQVVLKPGLHVKYPWRLRVGDNCWIGEDAWLDNLGNITLADHVCISQGAYLCTGNHSWTDPAFRLIVKDIHLLGGSWVGARAVICPGVTLGAGAVASAGSVVTRDIPDFQVHAGNPASFSHRREIEKR
jgi:putative colanic acid biosynthesis acetyltransferase WcaF